jgi:uncharacterized SAM-binding protein YcdF (DUF218 family)
MNKHVQTLAEKVWHYHRMNHSIEKANAILVLCSHDEVVAERGAQLFLDGWAPLLIFSGGLGSITKTMWTEPEADRFANIAAGMGVPREKIIVENQSTNTGENILFTKQLLATLQIDLRKLIVVQKPYMERRAYATTRKFWPEIELRVTSPQLTFAEYLATYSNHELTTDDIVGIMVGDLQRLRLYPEKGFQIYQEIPDEVWSAYEELVSVGYTKYLIQC